MKASVLVAQLQEIIEKQGDLEVVRTEQDHYWGTLYYPLYDIPTVMNNCPLNGPKSWLTEKAIVLGSD